MSYNVCLNVGKALQDSEQFASKELSLVYEAHNIGGSFEVRKFGSSLIIVLTRDEKDDSAVDFSLEGRPEAERLIQSQEKAVEFLKQTFLACAPGYPVVRGIINALSDPFSCFVLGLPSEEQLAKEKAQTSVAKSFPFGTWIAGTDHTQDLIPSFMALLREVDIEKYRQLILNGDEGFPLVPGCAEENEDDPWWNSETARHLVNELLSLLSDYSPDGYYFGLRSCDGYATGLDYGYWPIINFAPEITDADIQAITEEAEKHDPFSALIIRMRNRGWREDQDGWVGREGGPRYTGWFSAISALIEAGDKPEQP